MMASEDVIELGSSDEESQPAPKKANTSKRRPNAMVQFPPGVTIKHAKSANHNINPIRKLIGKDLTVTKVNPALKQISASFRNGKPLTKPIKLPQIQNVKSLNPIPIPVLGVPGVNPLNIKRTAMIPFANSKPFSTIKVQNSKSINNLPSSITVTKKPGMPTKTVGSKPSSFLMSRGAKRPAATSISSVKKKQRIRPEPPVTVNLDDEDVPTTSTVSPQWYLRPEDETDPLTKDPLDEQSMEKQNNAEPKQFVEITIEDSPIKPVHNKRTHEIGAEFAITIDDSPVKLVADKTTCDSDTDKADETLKEKHSKKKLEYPKEGQVHNTQYVDNTIEIELEPITDACENNEASEPSHEVLVNEEKKEKENNIIYKDTVIEVIESPAKCVPTPPSTPKKVDPQIKKIQPIAIADSPEPSEFHPLYQEFIDLCLKLENSNDMNTIVEKKIKSYYRQVPKEYTESEEFIELVQSKLLSMKAGPEKLYLYIKDIVDELNLQRKLAKAKPTLKEASNIEAEKFQYGEESEFDLKRQRQIRKLEKTLKKLHRAIQKLEEQEVDFDDEEDSVYLLTERYKERMVRVHAKFCQLTNTKMPSEPRIQIQARPGQPTGPAKRIEKWINKKVPIGKPLPFPDFHDVLKCVRDANNEDKLGWNEAEIMEEARDLFTRCGKKLQRRRQENEWRLAASRISLEVDPAEGSEDLKKKLESNKQVAAKKETELFNKFADKQSQMNLEAIEISDKEADESPVESEDEEPQEEKSNLEDKEKRKERLRRLINEKSKKTEEGKDSQVKAISDNEAKSNEVVAGKEESKKHETDLAPEVNTDSIEVASVSQDLNKEKEETVQSISEDSNVGSDVDELHLLQKLHSDEVNTSTIESTDSDSPIDISDTLTSSDNKKPVNSDVISIENSSYSETESKDSTSNKVDSMDVDIKESENTKESVDNIDKNEKIVPESIQGEIEISSAGTQLNKTNNQEYNESVESILLASTDEEGDEPEKDKSSERNDDECVNLKDGDIFIGETVVDKTGKNEKVEKSSNGTTTSVPTGDTGFSSDNTINSEMVKENSINSKAITTKSKSPSEENPKSTKKVESNETIVEDLKVIQEIHSVESVDSDSVQVATEPKNITEKQAINDNQNVDMMECDVSGVQNVQASNEMSVDVEYMKGGNENSAIMNNASIETLETDNLQEAIKEVEDALLNDVQESETVLTLESDNSQESTKKVNKADMIKNIPVEALSESKNSQELAKKCEEQDKLLLNTKRKIIDSQELLNSDNSSHHQKKDKNELTESELNEGKKLSSTGIDGTQTVDCLLEDVIMPVVTQIDNST